VNNRPNILFAVGLAILFMILMQWLFPQPKKPVVEGGQEGLVAELTQQEGDPASIDDNDSDEAGESEADVAQEMSRKPIDPTIKLLTDGEILERIKADRAESAGINGWIQQRSLTSVRQMGDLVTIGSLDESGTDRYLITLNPYGGTVRRIELNVREPGTGKYKYRDLVWRGGYIGSLEVHDSNSGTRVGVVGRGTPADLAGIQAGDVLVSLDGEPVTNAEEFGRMMAVTKPDDTVTFQLQREGKDLEFEVLLTEKPIELIRPEPGVLDPTFLYDESFLMTLRVPSDNPRKPWDEIDSSMRDSQWEVNQVDANHVELSFQVSPAALKKHNLKGPVTVVKRFGVPEIGAEEVNSTESKTWHWDFDIEIKNDSDSTQPIGYELKGPTGTPSETWWYSQKTHGRANAFFAVAGARDVLGSTVDSDYQFWGNSEIVKESLDEDGDTFFLVDPYKAIETPEAAQVNWLGVDTLYFNVTMFPKMDEGKKYNVFSAFAEINGGHTASGTTAPKVPKNAREHKLVDCTFRVFKSVNLPANGTSSQPFEVFSAPKDPEVLDQYELSETRAFGWFWWCSKPLLWLMHLLYWMTFSITYTIPIIIITCIVRSLMIPFSRRAALNAQMMQHLQPEIKAIKEKFPDDMQKQAAAQQELFKKYNYRPLGGCLMGFIQLPVFLGLYRGLSLDIALRDQPLIPGLSWCGNLSGPDQLMYWKHFLPSWLGEAGWFGPFLNILPLATMALFLIQQKMFTPPAVDEQQKMMQKMMSFMMLFMAIMFFKVPAGLCVYFVTSSIWAILEKKLLPKPELDTSKYDNARDGSGGTTTGGKGGDKGASLADKSMALLGRSRQSDEEQARQKVEERKQRNRDRKRQLKDKGKK
jgi:YidC/Oxa1 family membrane protein insertase